jgi:hypothetical protein
MNGIQIKQFNEKLNELERFAQDTDKTHKESEIIDWISECINVFYEIGVDSVIIRHFLNYFSLGSTDVEVRDDFRKLFNRSKEFEKVKNIGPFFEIMEDESDFDPNGLRVGTGEYSLRGSFYYAKVAFSSARNVLNNKIEERRIVPSWLAECLLENNDVSQLTTSLELIENKYKQRDSHGLTTESVTLLQSVLNLDPDLAKKNRLGGKLNSLIEDKEKRKKFGTSKDLIMGLNCERIIRNEKVIHKDTPLKYELPFMIATSFAYLVLFFVECAILNGKIIKNEK